MGGRILIVDDNQEIHEVVTVFLENEGYEVEKTGNGEAAVAKAGDMDLIVLDAMMPKMDSFKVCRQIRKVTSTPILFLTAKTMNQNRAFGFSSGGDDYLTKPLPYSGLIARVGILLHRCYIYKGREESQEGDRIIIHDLIISRNSNQAKKKEEAINLTEMEYQILLLLADHPKEIFSNQELYGAIWREPYVYLANNTIMVRIRNLRKKLGIDPQSLVYTKTVWGKGYRFD